MRVLDLVVLYIYKESVVYKVILGIWLLFFLNLLIIKYVCVY